MPEAPPPSTVIRPATPCWYVRGPRDRASGLAPVTCFRGDAHPDGVTVPADADRGDASELWSVTLDSAGRPLVSVRSVPESQVWFVLLAAGAGDTGEGDEAVDEIDLVAFESDDMPAGTVITDTTFRTLPVANEAQVAAIRWDRSSATVDQLYVLPERRRQRLGTLLVYAASAVHQANGWPGALRADGRRTRVGDRLVGSLPYPQRIDAWTQVSPPMDPTDPTDPTDASDATAPTDEGGARPVRRAPR